MPTNVGLAVVGDFFDLALAEVALDLPAVEPLRLARQAHHSADLVKGGLALLPCGLKDEKTSRRSQIDGVLGVPVEVGPRRQPRRGNPVDHGSVAQHGQVEAVAVECDELRAQLRDLVAEGGNQLFLGPFPYVGRAYRLHSPVIWLPVRDESPMQTIE